MTAAVSGPARVSWRGWGTLQNGEALRTPRGPAAAGNLLCVLIWLSSAFTSTTLLGDWAARGQRSTAKVSLLPPTRRARGTCPTTHVGPVAPARLALLSALLEPQELLLLGGEHALQV